MMDLHLDKCMRIISDLVAFCHAEGAEEYKIYLTHGGDGVSSMTITCPIPGLKRSVIDRFTQELNIPRQHEIEQNYWELSGESELSGELTLVGMMIDEAEVGYMDGVLYIHAWRKD